MSEHGQDQISPAMEQAIQLLSKGQRIEAEELLVRAVREAEASFGPGSHALAVAHNDLGNLHGFLGDMKRAAASYARACEGEMPDGVQACRDRLTHLVNLAGALEALGQLDEAERMHRQSVAGRESFYGADHAGYGFGLEPLTRVLLRQGKHQEALEVANETVMCFWRNGHRRVAVALAIQAEALKAVGSEEPPFDGLDSMPEEILLEMAETVISRSRETNPVWARQVFADLLPLVESRCGAENRSTLNLLAAIANHEADQGEHCDHAIRLSAIRRSLEILEQAGANDEALQALQGLALALNAAGQDEEALSVYQQALTRAQQHEDRGIVSQVRRNYGLYLADLNRLEDAEQQLRQAADDGERAEDLERWGRADVSLGIFLMHQGRGEEARPFLDQALRRLDPTHPDTVYARQHLNALDAGQACHCSDSWEALADQLRVYILKQAPRDLLEDLEVHFEGEDIKVGVHLQREPTEEEMEHLQILINQAIHTFKTQITRRS